ncbi:MAG: DUF2158 domain-containing protein [Chloroflexi bacterium]|nr:DUF2158 domain-containing protein [Chloroflexota bacterium]MBE3117519.1 DUF2158 domain-containing protein [Candidatus Atribacteria bacterium]
MPIPPEAEPILRAALDEQAAENVKRLSDLGYKGPHTARDAWEKLLLCGWHAVKPVKGLAYWLDRKPEKPAEPAPTSPPHVGDVVRLKSGGPDMTVNSEMDADGDVDCCWFDERGHQCWLCPAGSLVRVSPAEPPAQTPSTDPCPFKPGDKVEWDGHAFHGVSNKAGSGVIERIVSDETLFTSDPGIQIVGKDAFVAASRCRPACPFELGQWVVHRSSPRACRAGCYFIDGQWWVSMCNLPQGLALASDCRPCPPRPEKLPEGDEYTGECRMPKKGERYLIYMGGAICTADHDFQLNETEGIRWIVRRKQETPPLDEHAADAALWTGLQAEVASEGGADLRLEHSHRRDAAKAPPPRTFEEWWPHLCALRGHAPGTVHEEFRIMARDTWRAALSAGQESIRPLLSYRHFKEKAEKLEHQVAVLKAELAISVAHADALERQRGEARADFDKAISGQESMRAQVNKMAEDCASEVERTHRECDVALAAMRKAIREYVVYLLPDGDTSGYPQLAVLAKAAEEGNTP